MKFIQQLILYFQNKIFIFLTILSKPVDILGVDVLCRSTFLWSTFCTGRRSGGRRSGGRHSWSRRFWGRRFATAPLEENTGRKELKATTMLNTKIFNEDPVTLFEEDDQFANACDEMMREIFESEKELPTNEFISVWDRVIKAEKKISAKLQQFPGHQELAKLVKAQQSEHASVLADLKDAQQIQEELAQKLKTKRSKGLFPKDEELTIPASSISKEETSKVVRALMAKSLAYKQSLVRKKKQLEEED